MVQEKTTREPVVIIQRWWRSIKKNIKKSRKRKFDEYYNESNIELDNRVVHKNFLNYIFFFFIFNLCMISIYNNI